MKRLSKSGSFSVYHNLDDEGLEKLITKIDCGIFASKAEGFGIPAIEFANYSIPVIVSKMPSLEYLQVGSKFKIVDPNNVEDLCKAMICALNKFEGFEVQTRKPQNIIDNWQEWANFVIYKSHAS